ncbi:MAG: bifunctional adenosylcobinamide kinase/adenosylcobinamide-phosphate guanylyltransferase, partial [Acidaminobacteraceae bacterium]
KHIKVNHDSALLDCLTIMCSNIMFADNQYDFNIITREEIDSLEKLILTQAELLLEEARKNELSLILVTNELGMGIVPENRLARIFRDIAGKVNQLVAKESDEVYFVVSGIEIKIK